MARGWSPVRVARVRGVFAETALAVLAGPVGAASLERWMSKDSAVSVPKASAPAARLRVVWDIDGPCTSARGSIRPLVALPHGETDQSEGDLTWIEEEVHLGPRVGTVRDMCGRLGNAGVHVYCGGRRALSPAQDGGLPNWREVVLAGPHLPEPKGTAGDGIGRIDHLG